MFVCLPARADYTVEVSYRTSGLSWQPDYAAVMGDGDRVDLTSWATVKNDTGLDLVGAQLTLVDESPVRSRAVALSSAPLSHRVAPVAASPSCVTSPHVGPAILPGYCRTSGPWACADGVNGTG